MLAKLIEALELQAKTESLSRTQLAARLGVSENYIYRLKDGSRTPGIRFLTSIRREYPSLKPLIWEYEETLATTTEKQGKRTR